MATITSIPVTWRNPDMRRMFAAAIVLFSIATSVFAVDMSSEIDTATAKILPQVIEWRRYIHQHPELSNREVNTAKFVADHLRQFGVEVRTGIAKTGVVGILKGGQPGSVIGLRADMDALPVTERVDVPFKSVEKAEFNGQTVGVMHACGHDSHIAMLLNGRGPGRDARQDKRYGCVYLPACGRGPAGK